MLYAQEVAKEDFVLLQADWLVEKAAVTMALAFYESLFTKGQGKLDTALLHARRTLAGNPEGYDSGDWFSPVLIVQG